VALASRPTFFLVRTVPFIFVIEQNRWMAITVDSVLYYKWYSNGILMRQDGISILDDTNFVHHIILSIVRGISNKIYRD
jgi:hypothetical protein